MMKTLTTLTAAATVAAALTVAPTDAFAQRRGAAIGLGILGGVAAGAIIGGAIANSYGPGYVVQPGYAAYPGYYAAAPVGCPGGYWARVPVYDPYGNVVGWRGRPRYFCP
jgi:MFS family permease